MTIPLERWLLDTNDWVFGLRRDPSFRACADLLDLIGTFFVLVPLQVLKELNLTLAEDEMRQFYQIVNQYPKFVDLNWEPAPLERVRFYEEQGCRKGDAVIAPHAEALNVRLIVSENRQFLQTVKNLPVRILTAAEATRIPS
jgi:predicted nucleic acid-binding protein